jgi:3'(2'), 5'-bisphosphate nucleotidase
VTRDERRAAAHVVLEMARDAAAVVARVYEHPFDVEYKSKNDPVTTADRQANALLCDALASRFPGMPVVAEESDPASYAGYHRAAAAWFVDPLDGTRDFVKRNGEFVVMIGLAEEGRATLGVIVVPVSGRAFVGGDGVPGVLIDAAGDRAPLHVSKLTSLEEAELVVSRSRSQKMSLEDAAARLGVRKLTPCGSAGLKAMRVATGEADAYVQGGRAGKLWDACAPEAIVVAAGGRVSDADGTPFDYGSPDLALAHGFLATTPALYPGLLDLARRRLPLSASGGRS